MVKEGGNFIYGINGILLEHCLKSFLKTDNHYFIFIIRAHFLKFAGNFFNALLSTRLKYIRTEIIVGVSVYVDACWFHFITVFLVSKIC